MTQFSIQQKSTIDNYRKNNNLSSVLSDDAVAELIKKEMESKGIVYSGFESLTTSNAKVKSEKSPTIFGTEYVKDEDKGLTIERTTVSNNEVQPTQSQSEAIEFLDSICSDAETVFENRQDEAGVVSKAIVNFFTRRELKTKTVKKEIQALEEELKVLDKASKGELTTRDFLGDVRVKTFEEAFKQLRGVEFNEENISDCSDKAQQFAGIKSSVDMINQLKELIDFTTRGDVQSQLNPQDSSAAILQACQMSGINSIDEMNKTLKDIEEKYQNHPDMQKYGGNLRFAKNKQGKYAIYRTAPNGYPTEATNEQLKLIAKEMGLRLDKALASALGIEFEEDATAEEIQQLTQQTVDKYKAEYEESFKKAYGKKDVKALAEAYVEKQQQGVANFEMVVNIASMALMLVPGGAVAGSNALLRGALVAKNAANGAKIVKGLQLVDKAKTIVKGAQTLQKVSQAISPIVMANMTLRPTELLEQLTSKNGMSAEEWESWGVGVLQNSVYMAAGMGASKLAEVGASMYKTKALVTTLKSAGKTGDEIIAMVKANPVKFPNEIVKSLTKVDKLAKTLQISSEVALDLSSTVLINKAMGNGDLLPQDVINSIAFAISGGVIQKQFLHLSTESKIMFIQETFKDYGITRADAQNVLKAMDMISEGKAEKVRAKSGEVNQNTPATNSSENAKNKIILDNVVNDFLDGKVDDKYVAVMLRDIDNLEEAFRVAETHTKDKVKLAEAKNKILENVNKNITDHGSIVLQSEIPASKFSIDPKTGVRYAIASQDDIFLVHAVPEGKEIESISYLVDITNKKNNDAYLSLSLVNKNSTLFGDGTSGPDSIVEYGIIPKNRSKNVTSAGFGQASSYKKNFSTFVQHSSFENSPEEYVYLKNSLLNNLKEKGYDLTDKAYIVLFNELKNKEFFNEITNDIKIGDKVLKAGELRDALEASHIELSSKFMYGESSNNEVTSLIDGVKAIFARVDNINDVKPEIKKLAKDNELDIVLLGKPTKLDVESNPQYQSELKSIEQAFKDGKINMIQRMQQKSKLRTKYKTLEIENLRAKTTSEKLCIDKKLYDYFLNKNTITSNDIKLLFPAKGFDKENYFMQEILKTIRQINPKKHIVNFNKPFDTTDYEIIAKLFNIHNGKYRKMWLTKSETDEISNIEKLAIFARIIKSLKKVNMYLNFDEKIWNIITKGIVEKPQKLIKPLIKYKINSNEINGALTKNVKMTPEIKEMIEEISKYIADSPIEETINVYRGETSYWIFGNKEISNGVLLREEMAKYEACDKESREAFIADVLMDIDFEYPRFLSTAFDINDAEARAEKILWHLEVPKNTKGTMIESYNIERESESEFLIQRSSELSILDVIFNEEKKRWEIFATVLQRVPLTPLE